MKPGGGGAGDVDVAGGIEREGEADISLCSKVSLGDDVGGGGVGLEDAEAVVLVDEEVDVAGGNGLDGVELALVGGGTAEPVRARLEVWAGVMEGRDNQSAQSAAMPRAHV